jgi:hypothetical protein
MIVVEVVEYERGWGQRLIDTLEFKTQDEAKHYVDDINSHNTAKEAPDTYIAAHIKGC